MATAPTPALHRWTRWLTAWAVLSLPGLCVAVLIWGPGRVVVAAAVLAVPLAFVVVLAGHGGQQGNGQQGQGQSWSTAGAAWIARMVLCAVTVTLSTAAVGAIVPWLTLLILVVAGATTPPAIDLGRRLLRSTQPVQPQPPAARVIVPVQMSVSVAEAAHGLSDAELCRAWRRSFWTLRDARDPVEKLTLVQHRQCFLDELEARNAQALQAWLDSGARPSQGPERFLDTGEGDQPTAA